MCKGNRSSYKATTAADVDVKFDSSLSWYFKRVYIAAGGIPENMLERAFYHWYGYWHCGAHSRDEYSTTGKGWHDIGTVKDGVDNAWACGHAYALLYGEFDCKEDWDCSRWDKLPKPACESISAMMTAVCNITADQIQTNVDEQRRQGKCKNKTDGGVEFSPLITPEATPAPTLSAASGSSPMWALALVACLFSAVPTVYPDA